MAGQEKVKRLVVGGTVAGVLLCTFLLGVIIFQIVRMCLLSSEIAHYNEQIQTYEQKIEEGNKDLEYFTSAYGLEKLAREHGYVFPGDK